MPQTWASSPRKRALLFGLSLLNRIAGARGRRSKDADPLTVERILVVELWNIGDIVLAVPFLTQLRSIFPRASVTLLARAHARELLEGTGLIDEFIETDLAWTGAAGEGRYRPAYKLRELRRLRRLLRSRAFDVAFQCRLHIRELLIVMLSGARRRVGYSFGNGESVLTDPVAVDDPDRHKTADWLGLLRPFGGPVEIEAPVLVLSESDREGAKGVLAAHGVTGRDIVVGIHPGASVAAKRWPLTRFREITEMLATRPGARVITFTEPGGYGDPLGEVQGVVALKVGLRDLMALIGECDLLVCNDSGPMHIAGGLGVPAVAVFAAGIDRWFSPLGEGHELIVPDASPAGERAGSHGVDEHPLAGVSVSRVLDGVERVLSRRSSSR